MDVLNSVNYESKIRAHLQVSHEINIGCIDHQSALVEEVYQSELAFFDQDTKLRVC